MYFVYLDTVLLPVTPEKITTKKDGDNKTYTLLNDSQINCIRGNKLTEFSFEILLPHQKYPFAQYEGGVFQPPSYYLEKLLALQNEKKAFPFKIFRSTPAGAALFDTKYTVTLESLEIEENAGNGLDILVSVELKEYKTYGAQIMTVVTTNNQTNQATATTKPAASSKPAPTASGAQSYTVKSGDSLWTIAKRFYGSGTKSSVIYNANKSVIEAAAKKRGKASSANGKFLYPGTTLTIPKG